MIILKQGPNTCYVALRGVDHLISYSSQRGWVTPFLIYLLDSLMIGNILYWQSLKKIYRADFFLGKIMGKILKCHKNK